MIPDAISQNRSIIDEMNKDNITVYAEFAQRYYAGKDPAHDFQHIQRIIERLPHFSQGLEPIPYKLCFLAAFHGLADRIHDDFSFRNEVTAFLQALKWDEKEIEDVFVSLANHLRDPCTPEEMIVHDANYVEVLGAFGIAKAFTTGGAKGQSYEATADIFENNINHVAFYTPKGKQLAEEEKKYNQNFLKRLRKELAKAG